MFAALIMAPLVGLGLALENGIFVVLLAMVALIPLVIRWPVISVFGLYAFLVPLDSVASLSESGSATLTKLAGLGAGAVLIIAGVIERRLGRPPLAAIWWILFVVWAALSAAWAIDQGKAVAGLRTALSLFFLYLTAVSFRASRKELLWVCVLVTLGGMVAASTGYLFGVEEGATQNASRARITFGDKASNPNTLGAVLVLPVALAIGGFVGSRRPVQKLLALGAIAVLGLGIYISMSRGALVALIVTVVVFAYRAGVRWQLLVPAAVLLSVVAVAPEFFFVRVAQMFDQDSTGAGRLTIWKVGIAALEQYGLFGVGHANYTEIYSFADAFSPGVWNKGAHNTYLEKWVELGIVGLVLMVAALAAHLLAAHRRGRADQNGILLAAIEAACFGTLASAFFSDAMNSKAFWFPWILLTWAIYNTWGNARDTERASTGP